jgi:predicted amidohydrolase
VRGGNRVDGFRPVWNRRRADRTLDPDDVRLGPWVGGDHGDSPVRLGSGLLVVGVHGRAGLEVDALGLVELGAGPEPYVDTVRVAAVQAPSVLGDVEANRARLTALVEKAAAGGAKIVVLPETAVTGYLSQDLSTNWHVPGRPLDPAFSKGLDPAKYAEEVPGPSTTHFAALAARSKVWIAVPLLEVEATPSDLTDRDGSRRRPRYFNSVVLVAPKGEAGEIAAHYRKLNPWPHPEKSWAETGDRGLVTAETEWGRVGLAICYDVHSVFPGYAAAGIWTLLYSIAWVSDGNDADWFGRELPARAAKAGFHVVGANWSVDAPQPWHGYGHSAVISKYGAVMAKAKTAVGDEIVYADLPRAK